MGSGCDSVGRAVASDTRGPLFISNHHKTLYYLYNAKCTIEKNENKEKEVRDEQF